MLYISFRASGCGQCFPRPAWRFTLAAAMQYRFVEPNQNMLRPRKREPWFQPCPVIHLPLPSKSHRASPGCRCPAPLIWPATSGQARVHASRWMTTTEHFLFVRRNRPLDDWCAQLCTIARIADEKLQAIKPASEDSAGRHHCLNGHFPRQWTAIQTQLSRWQQLVGSGLGPSPTFCLKHFLETFFFPVAQ